jgi:hypothetical protein
MYRKPHHKFLQNFPVVDVSQVAICVSSQISERVIGEGSFAKGFAMSSDSQYAIPNTQVQKGNFFFSTQVKLQNLDACVCG